MPVFLRELLRMSSVSCNFRGFFRWLNKERRDWMRKLQLTLLMRDSREKHCFPKTIKQILFVSTSLGIGDALYILGLVRRLNEKGIHSSIACLDKHIEFYEKSGFLQNVYSVSDSLPEGHSEYSVIVDLEYRDAKNWKLRKKVIFGAQGYRFTTSPLCRALPFYDEYIDYSNEKHISQRLALIYQRITGDVQVKQIMPYSPVDADSLEKISAWINEVAKDKRLVYLNAQAGDKDRWFTEEQTLMLLRRLSCLDNIFVVVQPPEASDRYILGQNICLLPKMSFEALCALIGKCSFVVTPDTSVTHVAASFDVPCYTVFPPNDRDFFKEFGAWETWGALSTLSLTLHPDEDGLLIDRFGFSNYSTKSMSSLSCSEIEEGLQKFLEILKE